MNYYQFRSEINWNNWYFFSKELVLTGQWAGVSQATRSILPVIMMFRNSDSGEAFPSHQTIGALAGISEKTVSQGIKYIDSLEGFSINEYMTSKGNKAYKYHIPKYSGKNLIKINHSLFESGHWHMLSHSAKSVYIVLRVLAECECWEYMFDEEDASDGDKERYRLRKYDLARFDSYSQLARLAGISRQTLHPAIDSLKNIGLIADHPDDEQIIYIEPKDIYKREYLNAKLKKSFGHKQKKL